MFGMSLQILWPGEANAVHHWNTEQDDFLVLFGEALLIVEGQERLLKHRHNPAPEVERQDGEVA